MKVTGGMVALAVLLVISVATNFVLYSTWTNQVDILKADKASLKQDITSLQTQVTSLQTQVNNLESTKSQSETQIANLQLQVANLQLQVDTLETENAELRAADLGLIDTWWEDIHPLFGTPYVHVYGTVVNFGDDTAHNVVVTVKIYQEAVLLKTHNIPLADIYGEWYGKFDVNIDYSGDATSVETTVSHT